MTARLALLMLPGLLARAFQMSSPAGGMIAGGVSSRGSSLRSTANDPPEFTKVVALERPFDLVLEEVEPGLPGVRVKEVESGGRAARAGVMKGARIVAVGSTGCDNMGFNSVVDLIEEAGSNVELRLAGAAASAGSTKVTMSTAIPFAECPKVLAKSDLAGNAGFDPVGFSGDSNLLQYYREAEIKHARLAMMAAVGWPAAELLDRPIATVVGLPAPLDSNAGLNPALLNGGLLSVPSTYWAGVILFTAAIEAWTEARKQAALVEGVEWVAGDLDFDPLGLYPSDDSGQKRMQLAEIKHGRVAMIVVVAFACQEAVTKSPVFH